MRVLRSTGVVEEALGSSIVVYQVAAQWMRANNQSSQELDDIQKQRL